MNNSRLFCVFIIILTLVSCNPDPNPKRLIKSIGLETYHYDNNSNLTERRLNNSTSASYKYDSEERLVLAKNYSGYWDSTRFQYSGNTLKSSVFYQYEGNPSGQLVKTIYSEYIFQDNSLIQKDDSTNLYWENQPIPDSSYHRTTLFRYLGGYLLSKEEVYIDNTIIEYTFEFDDKKNPMSGNFGISTFYHSPQLIDGRLGVDNSVWPSIFQTQNNLKLIIYTRKQGCAYSNDGSGSGELSITFQYDNEDWPIAFSRGLFDGCVGVGPDVLSFQIEYF